MIKGFMKNNRRRYIRRRLFLSWGIGGRQEKPWAAANMKAESIGGEACYAESITENNAYH